MKKSHRYRLVFILWLIVFGFAAYFLSYSYVKEQMDANEYSKKELAQQNKEEPAKKNTVKTHIEKPDSTAEQGETADLEQNDWNSLEEDVSEDDLTKGSRTQVEPYSKRDENHGALPAQSESEIPPMFQLKTMDNYVIVFYADGITMYENTGILLEDLPEDLRLEIGVGKPIFTLDELYNFLENYSS